ncbi:acetate/propionate family kinase [Bradyrhizobium sp. BRP22]|uniref:acetate/propionate family kinase n=1 Tax=Bradyrhizobium sp. BRP22 TaxID=2793821 RepID=UPI001CD66E30|nr:acetate/propionate family kinase [Bradyrhizobium sp. BRP22]MCA1453900.1 acetate/propionate family kinase [Bradyrhizobium sp. BRP22]
MPDALLVLNAGSSSIKLALFESGGSGDPALPCKGMLDHHQHEPQMIVKDLKGNVLFERHAAAEADDEGFFADLLRWIDGFLAGGKLVAVGHRVVHGGLKFFEPVQVTPAILQALHELTPLAPLHQPVCLAPIEAMQRLRPDVPQIACFDTAFHHGLAPPMSRFALPRHFEQEGMRRYGFHGLSYEFIARHLRDIAPEIAAKRVVIAHLGSGASLCAMRDGRSIDTTMSFTTLDGLMMGTRCGAIDPGLPLYLQQQRGLSADEIEHVLYYESGLLGVSGISADVRVLENSDDPRAVEALELFAFRAGSAIAAMAHSLGGLDAIIFTAGIGENSPEVRRRICAGLGWLGVELDEQANSADELRIGARTARVATLVVPTDEEAAIAAHSQALITNR